MKITSEIIQELKALQERTGMDPRSFLKSQKYFLPESITSQRIAGWISGTIPEDIEYDINRVISCWSRIHPDQYLITITAEMQGKLIAHTKRTGASPSMIIRKRQDRPEGLVTSEVDKWIGGILKRTTRRKWNYVNTLYEHCPFTIITITEQTRRALQEEKERTGLGGSKLITLHAREKRDKPEGLYGQTIDLWRTGKKRMGKKEHIEYALKLYRRAPDEIHI